MKKLTSIILFSVFVIWVQGANTHLLYKLKTDCLVDECNSSGTSLGNGLVLVPAKTKFTIVGRNAAGVNIIKFWNWKLSEAQENTLKDGLKPAATIAEKSAISPATVAGLPATDRLRKQLTYSVDVSNPPTVTQRYFLITDASLAMFANELVPIVGPSFGAVTLPFKYRPSGKDFTKDISLGGMGGIKFNATKDLGVDLLIGVGVASVTLDKDNTDGQVTESTDRAAVTVPFGVVLEWKRLQIGLFGGVDRLAKKDIDGWQYQGKPWVALGVGLSIFSAEDVERKEGKNTN